CATCDSLPDGAEQLAADVLAPSVAVEEEALRRGEDAHAEPAADGGNLLGADVHAKARAADPLQAEDHRPPLRIVAELDAEDVPGLRLDDARAAEIPLGDEHLGERLLLPRPR